MKKEDVKSWVVENLPQQEITSVKDIDHISMCLHHIWEWHYEGRPLGGFLTAVVQDRFARACIQADDVNRKVLHLYALFLYNHIGEDYKEKALAKAEVK